MLPIIQLEVKVITKQQNLRTKINDFNILKQTFMLLICIRLIFMVYFHFAHKILNGKITKNPYLKVGKHYFLNKKHVVKK